MQKTVTIIFFLLLHFCSTAQKTKPPVYFFTRDSEIYLSDEEVDSVLYNCSAQLFKENMISPELFEQKYPVVKSLLLSFSKNVIVQSFKKMEAGLKKNIVYEKGTAAFAETRKHYIELFTDQLKAVFYENKLLSKYLVFDNSDRIIFFNSTIRVQTNGKLLVEEKITIHNGDGGLNEVYGNDAALIKNGAINNEIKRGIFRAFPLNYINRYKLFQNTTFELRSVLRDGRKEDHHTEKQENGIALYTGNSNVFLEPGNYTYTIIYETSHQLKFGKDYDELYWNVTGNGWSFRIDSARCTLILPRGAGTLSSMCYTGYQNETSNDCRITNSAAGDSEIIVFKTNGPLLPKQGLTIASSWQKGIVSSPSDWQQLKYYVWNNKGVFFLPIAALFSAIFCFIFWFRYGRDPEKGTIYPQFEPPAGYCPAALGYIFYQKFDRQFTAATIVDAAVRNKIKIDVEREGWLFKHNEYNIGESKSPGKKPESDYEEFESDITDLLNTRIEKGKYNSELGSLNTTIEKYCESNYKNKDGSIKKNYKGFFALNNSYTTIPVLVCMIAAGWGFFGGIVKAMMMRNFWQIGYYIGGIILCVYVLKIFAKLLAAYSPEGQKLRDKIEGFRMFLSTADEKRFDLMNPPEKSLELYEKYLPFAIALGCAIEWGNQFESIIETAYLSDKATNSFSQSFSRNSQSYGSSFTSSFSGAISSASSPPSSSSGGGSSFGGGSSGGGGGGGGGGGW